MTGNQIAALVIEGLVAIVILVVVYRVWVELTRTP